MGARWRRRDKKKELHLKNLPHDHEFQFQM